MVAAVVIRPILSRGRKVLVLFLGLCLGVSVKQDLRRRQWVGGGLQRTMRGLCWDQFRTCNLRQGDQARKS